MDNNSINASCNKIKTEIIESLTNKPISKEKIKIIYNYVINHIKNYNVTIIQKTSIKRNGKYLGLKL